MTRAGNSEASQKLSFRRMTFAHDWYPSPRSPRFYLDAYTIPLQRKPGAEVFAGLEIDVVQSGNGNFYLDGRRYELTAGDVFFYDCMIPHDFQAYGKEGMKLLGGHMMVEAVIAASPVRGDMRLYEPFVALRSGLSPLLGRVPAIGALLKEALRMQQSRRSDWDVLAWSRLFAAVTEVRARFAATGGKGGTPKWSDHTSLVVQALECIHAHFAEPLSLDSIAAASACSASTLSHVFAQVMHASPIDYRNRLRVVRAVEMICQTDAKLNRVALDVGFESLSQFYALFRRLTGRTPASLRGK
jgi:AraC-like DNA-binding protein